MIHILFFSDYKMPNAKRSHNENRKAVCLLCFKKPKNQLRKLSDKVKQLFVKHIISDNSNKLSPDSLEWLPIVFCITCSKNLSQLDINQKSNLKYVDYCSLTLPQEFRDSVVTRNAKEVDCKCHLCEKLIGKLLSLFIWKGKIP